MCVWNQYPASSNHLVVCSKPQLDSPPHASVRLADDDTFVQKGIWPDNICSSELHLSSKVLVLEQSFCLALISVDDDIKLTLK